MAALYPQYVYLPERKILELAQGFLHNHACFLYWSKDSYFCGGLRLKAVSAINLDYDFVLHRPDDIWLYAPDAGFVFHLEYFEDNPLPFLLEARQSAYNLEASE